MASKRNLALLTATTLVFALITGAVCLFLAQPCAIPSGGGGDSSAGGPSPSPAGLDAAGYGHGFCYPLPRAVVYAVSFVLGALNYEACKYMSDRFGDADDADEEAPGAAKSAGYVAIRGDVEAGGGRKN
uniref:Uncharacterized protein n=1 Tax=Arundo donax TaxID=35708 RepID=A0A0A9AP93_ARUDO